MSRSSRATHRVAALALAAAVAFPVLASRPTAVSAVDTVTVLATADAQIKSANPAKNYGATSELRARDAATDIHRSFLSFRIPTFATAPKEAALHLFVVDDGPAGGRIHRVTGAWTEAGITWATAPAIEPTALAAAPRTTAVGQWFRIAIPATAVRSGARLDLALLGGSTNSVRYTSSETSTGPRLVLRFPDAVPAPTAPALPTPTKTPTPTTAPVPTAAATPSATPMRTVAPTPSATATPAPTTARAITGVGVLVDPALIRTLPMSGSAWTKLKAYADEPAGAPDIQDQDSAHDIRIFAKALVYARTGDGGYRASVIAALKAAVGTEDGGRTLALARNLPGYVMAADLVALGSADASFDTSVFRPWLRSLLTEDLDGMTLRSTHELRPNNWGTHAGAARAAVAAYLGDGTELARTALVFRGWLGDRTAYAGFSYGDLSWQADATRPVGINPAGATKDGVAIGGAIPDDMRRGASFRWPAVFTDYPWEAMQGVLLQALILDQAGYDAFAWSGQAVRRASDFLYDRAGWAPTGDDTWQPWIINHVYGTSRPQVAANVGKNMAFTDWLYGN